MHFDDDDLDDFDDDNDDDDGFWRSEEEIERLLNHPLALQAKEVMTIVIALVSSAEKTEEITFFTNEMRASAMTIYTKTAAVLPCQSYVLCMQEAAAIREYAERLRLSNHFLHSSGAFDSQYVDLLRSEMETFRLLFRDWAATISGMEDEFEDEWGLFRK